MPSIWCMACTMPAKNASADAMAVVGPAGQQQIFELIEGDDDRDLQALEDLHEHLEQRQHQVLPARADLEIQLREAKVRKLASSLSSPSRAARAKPW